MHMLTSLYGAVISKMQRRGLTATEDPSALLLAAIARSRITP